MAAWAICGKHAPTSVIIKPMGQRKVKSVMNPEPENGKHGIPFDSYAAHHKKKSCTDKIPYYSAEDAESVALNVRASRKDKNIYPYECQYGDHWHLGHKFD